MAAKIETHVDVREYPDNETPYNTLVVRNHWNDPDKVLLTISGVTYTFIAKHLKLAIDNATNSF